jgi:hypothetical protein
MASECLDGPKKGHTIWLHWAGATAREEDGAIFLSHKAYDGRDEQGNDKWKMEEYVKFEIG